MHAANGRPIHLIEDQSEFEQLCQDWTAQGQLAFDTEFLRTNTFYPKLGLLQIADESACFLIDPHSISSWEKFTVLLKKPETEFCVHSCSEDLNLLYTSINSVPAKLFDSQIAAAFLGLGFSLSYQALVLQLFGQEIPKDETRSDWLKRPLSKTQINYAANDVCYLLDLQEVLQEQLASKKMLSWFEEECANQITLAIAFENEDSWRNSYLGISNSWKLSDKKLLRLQKLCLWRELKARERNKPRNWIAKDVDMFCLANLDSATMDDVEQLELSDRRFSSRYGNEIIDLLGSQMDSGPAIDRSQLNFPLRPALRKKLKSCQSIVTGLADKLSMAPELLARKRLLQDLVRDYDNYGELRWRGELSGWRRELLEPEIKRLFA
ncbi:MAG: ribonuclease D [Gammaproteobacteria bacterium]|nr:ribonuclease D [Gammaproteobacteria bacterium]